jgi:hypothetical protein
VTEEQPGFRVTLKDVYSDVQEIKGAISTLRDALPNQASQLTDHEKRIRALETRVWAAIGGFGLLAAAAPYLSRLIP